LSSNSRPTPQTRSEVGVPELNAQFVPLALAEKRGFFREDGLQAEVIRVEREISLNEVADLSLSKRCKRSWGLRRSSDEAM
jgi:hypothetical protein